MGWLRNRQGRASMDMALTLLLGLFLGLLPALHFMTTPGAAATVPKPTMWVEPAVAEQAPLGPAHASGAVIWVHGLSLNDEDSRAPTPPYVKALADQGWDTFRLNRLREAESMS